MYTHSYFIHVETDDDGMNYNISIAYEDENGVVEVETDFNLLEGYSAILDKIEEMADTLMNEIAEHTKERSKSELDCLLEGDEDQLMINICDLYQKNVELEEEIERLKSVNKNIQDYFEDNTEDEEEEEEQPSSSIYDTILSKFNLIDIHEVPDQNRYLDYLMELVNSTKL